MDSALAWKQYYADERADLGAAHLDAMLEEAEPLDLGPRDAIVVPHTRLAVTGPQIARAAVTLAADAGRPVVALGVLHGARREDADLVARARAGSGHAVDQLRGVHDETGLAAEEFSLDALAALVDRVAPGRTVVRRYPFLVGDDPGSLPGLDEVAQMVRGGARLVVTTDPMHHGAAYGTPATDRLPADGPLARQAATAALHAQLDALAHHRFADFAELAARHRSDFRDTGPVAAWLLGRDFSFEIHDLALVDYAGALAAEQPSWVAGALVTLQPTETRSDAPGRSRLGGQRPA